MQKRNSPLDLFDLSGRVAIVTGGAGLLGAEFCRTLAGAGAHVVVADIDGEAASNDAEGISTLHADALGIEL